MDCKGPQVLHTGMQETFMQQSQPLRCRARNIPASPKFADLFMQQGPVFLVYIINNVLQTFENCYL